MKTKEELAQLKIEYETFATKLNELSEDELNMVVGGIGDITPKDRDIAMLFRSYALYTRMTVYDDNND